MASLRARPRRRRLGGFLVVALLATGLGFTFAPSAGADVVVPTGTRAFSSLYSTNTTGNILLRGNTLMTCPANSTGSGYPPVGTYDLTCAQAQGPGLWGRDNDFNMQYVNTDPAAVTAGYVDSSSAKITIPGGATVLKAYLMWSGQVTGTGTGQTTFNSNIYSAELKTPGSAYVQESSGHYDSTGTSGAIAYQGIANVTAAVQSAGSGMYTVANVQSTVGGNEYAGWSLAIAYQDPTQPDRNLDIYSGFANINTGNNNVAIPLSGFTTPATGPVVTEVGVVGWEGDRGNVGDSMTVGSSSLSNAVNPANDVFNSTLSDLGTAVTDGNPPYQNTLGTDIDTFDGTGSLADGATSTTVHMTTAPVGGETYYPGLVSFATTLNSPSLTATKTVNDVTNNTVTAGDVLNYAVTVTNTGTNGATTSVLTDVIPSGVTYVAGSMTIGGNAPGVTGAVSAGTLTARIGAGASSSSGGALAVGVSATVAFSATVNSAPNGTVITNTANLTYNDATTGVAFGGASDTTTSTVGGPTLVFPPPPAGQVGVPYADTLVARGGTVPYTWSVNAGTLPPGLTLNATTGLLSGTPTAVGTYDITLWATDASGYVGSEAALITVTGLALSISTPPGGEATAPYTDTLTATGGTGPYTYAVTSGALPAGLTLSSAGVISGSPTAAAVGTALFTVTATDALSATATAETSINVVAGPVLATVPPTGEFNATYSATLAATGGTGPYTYAVTTGSVPSGLALSTTGALTGTPSSTAVGTTAFTVTATDAKGGTATDPISLTIVPQPTLNFVAPPTGEATAAYSDQLTETGGIGPFTYAVASGLPPGITITTGGLLSGTPTAANTYSFAVKITDVNGKTSTRGTSVTVSAGPVLTFTPPSGEQGAAYTATFAASLGTGPYTYAVTPSSLPAGLVLSSGGVLSGTPTGTGLSSFTVTATDTAGGTAVDATSMMVVAGPALTFTPPSGEKGAAYTATFAASLGTGPYTYAVTPSSLPAGLVLSSGGVLSGTPTAAGMSSFTVTATDSKGQTATDATSITIVGGPTLAPATPPVAVIGASFSYPLSASGGTTPYQWTISSGQLPTGISINATTGLLSGTPSVAGTFPFTLQVLDADGQSASEPATLVVDPVAALTSSVTSVRFGTTVTLTATLAPAAASGTVTFNDLLSSGPRAGQTVLLGTGPVTVTAGVATLTVALPAFNTNTISATYGGDSTYAAVTSTAVGVQVNGYVGEVIVDEFRLSGPNGPDDSYVELYNVGPAVPLAGFNVRTSSGGLVSLPVSAPTLPTGHAYLVTGSSYSLGGVAASDSSTPSLGTGGVQVTAPDGPLTVVDAVGPVGTATGFVSGPGLPAFTATPTDQFAWVRAEIAGRPVDTNNNAADFRLVSIGGGSVGGVPSMIGSPAPRATGSPNQDNGALQSTLLDPAVSERLAPNLVYVAGTPGLLTVRRTITNSSGATVTSAVVRITSLSEANGAPEPGVGTQPARPAVLTLADPSTATSTVGSATVDNLSVDPPAAASPGGVGGLNSTLTVPLPNGGLAAGATINIAFTFSVISGGTYWFGYDVDALTGAIPNVNAGPASLRPQLFAHRAVPAAGTDPIRERSTNGGQGQLP